MKYHVSRSATLLFADGDRVELVPGISSYPAKVREHWAFSAHAKAVDDSDLDDSAEQSNVDSQIAVMQSEITKLNELVVAKDDEITKLNELVLSLTTTTTSDESTIQTEAEEVPPKETANAKKQSSSNK